MTESLRAEESAAPPGPRPRHVAIVMDGNGRWARARGWPRSAGHRAGVKSVRTIVEHCARRGVEVLTLFAFSSENWQRPDSEVRLLLELFLATVEAETARLHRNDVRLRVIGDRQRFDTRLRRRLAEGEALTAGNSGLQLVVAASYGGRWELARACRRLAERVAAGELSPAEIDTDAVASALSAPDLPEPDLFIRTGGERRLSNFLLWQLAYTEFYFTDVLWPDFDELALDAALADYACRQRRFGRTEEQLERLGNG